VSDIVVARIDDATDLLLNSKRMVAKLRAQAELASALGAGRSSGKGRTCLGAEFLR
jgi:hypothetical protein